MVKTKKELPGPAVVTYRRDELQMPVVFTLKPSNGQV